jgi:hypothetical protein
VVEPPCALARDQLARYLQLMEILQGQTFQYREEFAEVPLEFVEGHIEINFSVCV